jgi:MoxR-like ATPase
VLEENAKSIFVPELGSSIEVFPGTVIIATANSAGRGDNTALYASVQTMDESILDRFEVCACMGHLTIDEEKEIYIRRFSWLHEQNSNLINLIINASFKIRDLIRENKVYGSFSIRRVLNWLKSVEAQARFEKDRGNPLTPSMVVDSASDWLDWFSEEDRLTITRSVLTPLIGVGT